MYAMDNLRLRESVGIVINGDKVEFFKSNVREGITLKLNFPDILSLLQRFDGKSSISSIANSYGGIDIIQLEQLAEFLKENFILIEQDLHYENEIINDKMRLVNLLEDYFHSTSEVIQAINKINHSKVMIIGLGAVGSNIATYLTKSNVGNLVLVDNDIVEASNHHRQYFFEEQVSKNKADSLRSSLEKINPDIKISTIKRFLTNNFFDEAEVPDKLDLIINCADEPNVDTTSYIISNYAMKHNIPHIIGGGYNLHLTLIGQTVIPFKSCCFMCFKSALNIINKKDLKNVRGLYRENRKLGSFAPLSSIAASLASLDAFKILIGSLDTLQQTNKRIEFNMADFNFQIMEIERDPNCEWCAIYEKN